QCMKYSEWKDGVQIEGVISSMNGVSHKVGQAIGAMLVGFLLSASGYNGELEVQGAAASEMIKFLYIGLPAILTLIASLCMRGYRLEDKLDTIEADLAARKNA
ncbi:MAG: MFS transporter, partial [Solobacterium sp.]|nr:MFS transporter [Solobacterium sp.]